MVARPLTIVQMLPELITGGVERGTLEVGAYLVKNGHRSIVVSGGGPMVKDLEKNGSEHITLPVGSKNPRSLLCIPKLRNLFIEQKVDILHLRSRMPAWIGVLAVKTTPKRNRPRIVTTFHGFYSINKYSAIMTKAECVIAVSKTIKEHIKENYHLQEGKIQLIYRGFDANVFDPKRIKSEQVLDLKKKWHIIDQSGPIIILPGRFTKLKGHSLFLSALEKIKHLQWTAVIIGDEREKPEYADQLKKEAHQKGLSHRVLFSGHCSDMATAFMASDLTVSASIYPESFGRVAVESQAMGVPVIATSLGGSKETIRHGKTGWLFSHTKVDEFANILSQAIRSEKKRSHMGHQAREWVKENFSTDIMCKRTLGEYAKLMRSE